MKAAAVLRTLWFLGGLALLLGAARGWLLPESAPNEWIGSIATWIEGDFQPDGVYPTTTRGRLPPGTATAGSWIKDDAWQGDVTTTWIPVAADRVRICIAGYPQHRGCRLWVEFRSADGSVRRVECPLADAHETWMPWDLRVPTGTEALRIHAEDRAADPGGWLAFSEPISVPPQIWPALYQAAQIATTFSLTLTLLWLPGILLARRMARETQLVAVLGVGPLGLALTGTLVWLLGGVVRPVVASTGLVLIWWAAVGIGLWRRPRELESHSAHFWRVLAVCALVAAAAVAKAGYSGGPDGELFAGTHCRTLAAGDRPDARISFHIIQAAARHLGPTSLETEAYFAPWTFFSRGPLAGLAAVPVALATAGMPPEENGVHAWQPFDPTGYAAYRIVLITLGSMLIFALFAAMAPLLGERWALITAGVLALCPFGVHEVMFTWPKAEATAWLLASFALAHQRRPFGAGLALGVGLLFHPMAVLWAPWLTLWAGGRLGIKARPFTRGAARYIIAMSLLVLPWAALGSMPPQFPDSVQAGPGSFARYFVLAEYQPATWASWWQTRWANFSNTFLPFWLYLFNRGHSTLSDVSAPSGQLVRFAFGWWNTLPLGAGLALWAAGTVKLFAAARRLALPLGLFLVGPSLLLIAYWGAAATGLMRECGHPVLVAFIALFGAACVRAPGRLTRWVAHPAIPWLQLPETFLMLWLTTLLNPRPAGTDLNVLDPLYLTLNVLALMVAAAVLAAGRRASPDTDDGNDALAAAPSRPGSPAESLRPRTR